MVKNPPAMEKTWVQSLSQEDPLEKEMAIHSSIFVWRIPQTVDPGRLQSMDHKELDMTEHLSLSLSTIGIPFYVYSYGSFQIKVS